MMLTEIPQLYCMEQHCIKRVLLSSKFRKPCMPFLLVKSLKMHKYTSGSEGPASALSLLKKRLLRKEYYVKLSSGNGGEFLEEYLIAQRYVMT